ncbi:MAG: hypothetical protein LBQ81_02185 [Zoogloeaceae bacterium]|jgi:hypothetical protein|nr:hypothetical protein [Zoogloeaceae bacterium]
MNNRTFVKLSNVIGLIAIVALVYWVFTFVAMQVFGLRVFQENITETFFMSIFGILALMSGALMMNIMFNLTRIAEKHNQDALPPAGKTGVGRWMAIAASFPLILALLFGGDHLSTQKKEAVLTSGMASVVAANSARMAQLVDYRFDAEWIIGATNAMRLFGKMDSNLPQVTVIVADTLDDARVFLEFEQYLDEERLKKASPKKETFIRESTREERDYLADVFDKGVRDTRFSAYKGSYELFYPYSANGKTIVLYVGARQRYGKIGS